MADTASPTKTLLLKLGNMAAALWRGVERIPAVARLISPVAGFLANFGFVWRANRFVLTIGEAGATLVQLRQGQVVDALFVANDAEDGLDSLRDYLANDPKSEILVAADVLEQMFREEAIPKVSPLDRGKIIDRRLSMAFPNEVLKGSLKMPRKRGYPQYVLFAALPTTETVEKWTAFLQTLPNPILGVVLLPLEMTELATKLGPSGEGETRRHWRAIISEDAVSGVRQVFAKEGRFIVSRLTQKSARDMTPEAEAMLIEREVRSSISYIKRLGYTEGDRLDLIILADPVVCDAVQERDLPATSVTTFTPYQAGLMVGFGETGREDSPYADVLLALWMAGKRQLHILLPSPDILRRTRLAMVSRWCAAGTVLFTLATLAYTISFLSSFFSAAGAAGTLRQEMANLQRVLASQQNQLKNQPIALADLDLVAAQDTLLAQSQVNPVTLVAALQKALDVGTRVDSLDMETPPPPAPPPANAPANRRPAGPRVLYQLDVVVRFIPTGSTDPDAILRQARDFQTRLAAAFSGYTIDAVHLPTPLASQTLEVKIGSDAAAPPPQPTAPALPQTAEFLIKKMG